MRVFITGGSGSIGRNLCRLLLERGDSPVVLSRRAAALRAKDVAPGVTWVQGDPMLAGDCARGLDGCDAVVNLAGENLFGARWDSNVRRLIRDSRVFSTGNVIAAVAAAKNPPKTLVQASAIGFYGPRGDDEIDESTNAGSDFLAETCQAWENAASSVKELGTRLATVRIGVVLARDEGALGVMTPIFKWLPGGAAPVGSSHPLAPALGKGWLSWIHMDDIVGILLLALDSPSATGPINGTAPEPERNAGFGRALAEAVWRPFLPIGPPDALLKLILGEVAEVITCSQRVKPKRALELGYQFKYPNLSLALADLFASKRKSQSNQAPKATR